MANKKKVIYEQKYKKGITYIDHVELIQHLKEKSTSVEIINNGKYNDDGEFITIKIDLSPEYLKTI